MHTDKAARSWAWLPATKTLLPNPSKGSTTEPLLCLRAPTLADLCLGEGSKLYRQAVAGLARGDATAYRTLNRLALASVMAPYGMEA